MLQDIKTIALGTWNYDRRHVEFNTEGHYLIPSDQECFLESGD